MERLGTVINVSTDQDLFRVQFVRGVDAAAVAFGYERPEAEIVAQWLDRIPSSTAAWIGYGLRSGIVTAGQSEAKFLLAGARAGKGPYAWFSRNRGPGTPSPNWEYFFQVAEYVRIRSALPASLVVGFEDGLMDISVRRAEDLIWYVEVKPLARQIEPLLKALQLYGRDVDLAKSDRGDDPLRKAKYLVVHRPPSFSVVGGEVRRHFDVTYPKSNAFVLREKDAGPEQGMP